MCLTTPFSFTWLDVPVGDQLLTAVAVDNWGARATSAPVAFTASFPAALSIDDRTVVEGNGGVTEAIFTLSLSSASCHAVTGEVATFDGTALAGSDYLAAQASFIFLPGETQKTFTVLVLGDTEVELDETFFACLTNVAYATLARPCGLGTILNDDLPCSPDLAATPMPDQTRCVCDEVLFSTTVTSLDPVRFVWKFNGVDIPGETNSALHLQGLKPSQAGLYTVEISTACANTSRSATLTLRGAGNQNPVAFTNFNRIEILDHAIAAPYPSSIPVICLPGPVKHLAVTLDGLSHSFPDDVDILLVSPAGITLKLMSDCGGNASQKLTNVVLTFTDTAATPLPDASRIGTGTYRPTDYGAVDPFLPPAPQATPATSFAPFIGTDPNGDWSLFVVDDQGGDAGAILRGWYLSIEWEDRVPLLSAPALLPDGRFAVTLNGLPHMTHVLEASSDMVNWAPVATNTLAVPSVLLFDPRPGREPHRFYRAVRCP
jgi:subtilisin-like proprotein convertase family protein